MRILIHGINFSPELTGIGKYTGEMASWLASRGHEVRVVTAPPYYPAWKVGEGYSAWRYAVQSSGRLTVIRCPLYVPSRPSGLLRLVHLFSFALFSFPVMMGSVFWRPEVVWVVEPPFFCAPQAWLTAWLSGARSWLHIQDFEVDAAFDLGLLRGEGLRRAVSWVERVVMRRFDRVSSISPRMVERLRDKGVVGGVLFPNWVDLSGFTAALRSARSLALRAEFGLGDEVVALYSGNMGNKQGLEVLVQVVGLLSDVPVRFVFCGHGPGRAMLERECPDSVRFLDLQPVERLPELLCMADIHLLPQRADAADLVMPSKLTGMLASARPVVAGAHQGTALAQVVAGCGLVVPPDDGVAMASAIRRLVEDADLRQRLGQAGWDYACHHLERDAILNRFLDALTA